MAVGRPLMATVAWRHGIGGAPPSPGRWRAATVAALFLAGAPLVACGSDPTCDDVGHLQSQLDGMSPDDPDYNTTVEKLQLAAADCNG